MKEQILNLGKILSRAEQKSFNGAFGDERCGDQYNEIGCNKTHGCIWECEFCIEDLPRFPACS